MASLLPNATKKQFPITTHSNKLYGNLSVCAGPGSIAGCDGTDHHFTIEAWSALGLDPGTRLVSREAPPAAEIMSLARRTLGLAAPPKEFERRGPTSTV